MTLALGFTDEQIKSPGKAGYFAANVCLNMESKREWFALAQPANTLEEHAPKM